MQIAIEDRKNTRYERDFSKPRASNPSISRMLDFSPRRVGGVAGSVKLKIPRISDATAAILKVKGNCPCSQPNQPMINPATIHPIVPSTRTDGNCFSGSLICRNDTEFTNAKVGMYKIM